MTLSLVAVVTVLAFALASLSVTQSQMLTRMQQQRSAESLAQSATRLALERILARADYGTRPEPPLLVEALDGTGVVVFDANEAGRRHMPASYNNLNGARPVLLSGGSLSPGNARIVAEGRCGGARKLLECTLNLPSFPYAVAAGGRISCTGGITVAAIDSLSDLDRLASDPELVPGPAGISSNCPGEGVVLLGPSLISGDVESVGSVHLDPGTTVLGEIRSPKDSLNLPVVPLSNFDPQGKPGCHVVTSLVPNVAIRDQQRLHGNAEVRGDLLLSNGEVFVEGNLTVHGAIKGTGALVTTGNLVVEQGAALDATSRAALLCGGDLTMSGQSSESAFFSGLVYCHGQLRARQLTIVGALLTGGDNVASEQVGLSDCRVIKNSTPLVVTQNQIRYKLDRQGKQAVALVLDGPRLRISNGPINVQVGQLNDSNSILVDPHDLSSVAAINATIHPAAGPGEAAGIGLDLLIHDLEIKRRNEGIPLITLSGVPEKQARIEDVQALLIQVQSFIQQDQKDAMFTFDPSQFLQWRDRVKVSRWRSL